MDVLSDEYALRVYAGVLGKIIGVYLGRPFEGWSYSALTERFGEVDRYVHEDLGVPLVVADDDISGTFTFLRALEDHGFDPNLTSQQIGETWLNYLIEGRTVLWWGGNGVSTEHTAYLRLKHGVPAPESGSVALNGPNMAEQIGSQIFIDGWGLIHPGDPEKAADMAERAARVSHDGAAVDGAKVVAALVAGAFVETDIDRLLDAALGQISHDGIIARLIADVRSWHAEGLDWRGGYARIAERYGYDRYGGGCHMVPNHALIIHALLHGAGDFDRSMMIVNTCGWDTDCNSGNVGCILGVRNGLAAFEKTDWRRPIYDRLWIPTADGGRCVSDAGIETRHIVNAARRIRGLPADEGPRFSFSYPGSVQGFDQGDAVAGGLMIHDSVQSLTRTWLLPEDRRIGGYGLEASPTLYAGQTVRAEVMAFHAETRIVFKIAVYADDGTLKYHEGPPMTISKDETTVHWTMPSTKGAIAQVGLRPIDGDIILRSLDWDGAPQGRFGADAGWTDALDGRLQTRGGRMYLQQNEGTGLAILGTREWTDLTAEAEIHTDMASRYGLALRVQGLRRRVAIVQDCDGFARLVARVEEREIVLAKAVSSLAWGETTTFRLTARGDRFSGSVGKVELEGSFSELKGGGVGLLVREGRIGTEAVALSAPEP
ncbi:ADP-ribosylglycohydrolase family protein [soil metagenome]